MQVHWDIFCRVVDNYGDIGVCWRLARQLAAEHGKRVRLWVDHLASLRPLCPEVDDQRESQQIAGVDIERWENAHAVTRCADVVVEAFGCELPKTYLTAMAAAARKPCWINLEYLSAEAWAEDCHGMASPHPVLPLTKYFFFPGFTARSGGLLRETGLLAARQAFQQETTPRKALTVSLFCYEYGPIRQLLSALAAGGQPSTLLVPPGKPLAAVRTCLAGDGPWQCGGVEVRPIPFLPIDEYDRLLWRCDVNFVRGEDSFVRAQWAGRPFVWQIYRQEGAAHQVKLAAFLERYLDGMPTPAASAAGALFAAWNGDGNDLEAAWPAFLAERGTVERATLRWREKLAASDDLAASLVKFCASKV